MPTQKYILFILLLLLGLAGSIFLVIRVTVFQNRATSNSSSSLENSYLFASPLQAKADSQEKIRITVFLLDGRGLGIGNRPVEINTSAPTTQTNLQPTTDETGKAIFDIASSTPQTIEITAQTNGKTLPQKIKVMFY